MLEHRDLMTQDENPGVLVTVGPGEQGEPAEHAQQRQLSESSDTGTDSAGALGPRAARRLI
jgi:hypothetical protein